MFDALVRRHPFFLHNLTKEVLATMSDGGTAAMQAAAERPVQSLADLRQVLHEAQQMGPPA